MAVPKAVAEIQHELSIKRQSLQAQLDSVQLALESLERVFGGHATKTPRRPAKVRKVAKRKPKASPAAAAPTSMDASERRWVLLELLKKSEVGMTIAELRQGTPKMSGAERSNALNQLKVTGQIRRAGNAWVKAA